MDKPILIARAGWTSEAGFNPTNKKQNGQLCYKSDCVLIKQPSNGSTVILV